MATMISKAELWQGYYTMPDFRDYVDGYTKKYSIGVDTALDHRIVQDVYRQYKETGGAKAPAETTTTTTPCGC